MNIVAVTSANHRMVPFGQLRYSCFAYLKGVFDQLLAFGWFRAVIINAISILRIT